MTTKIDFIFKAIEDADITMTDFSRLTQISRETLYRWKGGGNITDNLRLGVAYKTALCIDKARHEELLPLKETLKAPARIKLLRQIITSMRRKP